MKKRKEEILNNKEQFTAQSTVQSIVRSTEQSSVQSTQQLSVQSTVQSNYVYGVGILAVLAIGVCVFLVITLFSLKNKPMKNKINHQNDIICFRSYIINE